MAISKTSDINLKIALDENKLPETIKWSASDSGMDGEQLSKAIMVSIWDEQDKSTLKIDLWTKDMLVDEMKLFFHQTLLSMADTLERSTGEDKMAGDMRDFCAYFAEKLELVKKE